MLFNVFAPGHGYVVRHVPYDVAREKMKPFYVNLNCISMRFYDLMRGIEIWALDGNGGRTLVCRLEREED